MIRFLGLLFALRLRLIVAFFAFCFLAMSYPQSPNHSRTLSHYPISANAEIFDQDPPWTLGDQGNLPALVWASAVNVPLRYDAAR